MIKIENGNVLNVFMEMRQRQLLMKKQNKNVSIVSASLHLQR